MPYSGRLFTAEAGNYYSRFQARSVIAGAGILASLATLMTGCSNDPEYTQYCVIESTRERVDDDYCEDQLPDQVASVDPGGGVVFVPRERDPNKPNYVWYYVRDSGRTSEGDVVSGNGTFNEPDSDNISDPDGGAVHGGFGSSKRKGNSSGS